MTNGQTYISFLSNYKVTTLWSATLSESYISFFFPLRSERLRRHFLTLSMNWFLEMHELARHYGDSSFLARHGHITRLSKYHTVKI